MVCMQIRYEDDDVELDDDFLMYVCHVMSCPVCRLVKWIGLNKTWGRLLMPSIR